MFDHEMELHDHLMSTVISKRKNLIKTPASKYQNGKMLKSSQDLVGGVAGWGGGWRMGGKTRHGKRSGGVFIDVYLRGTLPRWEFSG